MKGHPKGTPGMVNCDNLSSKTASGWDLAEAGSRYRAGHMHPCTYEIPAARNTVLRAADCHTVVQGGDAGIVVVSFKSKETRFQILILFGCMGDLNKMIKSGAPDLS